MKHSCGAILYTYDLYGKLGIILGMENNVWLPFKGSCEYGETKEETAIREIYEETCKLVQIDHIQLTHKFSSKHKHYHIGLCQVPYDIIHLFAIKRKKETNKKYTEKTKIRCFTLDELRTDKNIHNITKASIRFYWNDLIQLSKKRQICQPSKNEHIRSHRVNTTSKPTGRFSKLKYRFFKKPIPFNMNYTHHQELIKDKHRVWRKPQLSI